MKKVKTVLQSITVILATCTIFAACGETSDPNANGPVLPDTTNQDSLANTAPAAGMGPNTVAPDSTSMPADSMKGTRGNSASDTSKPSN